MSEPIKTTIVYCGRRDQDSYAYIRQDTGEKIHFSKRLQKHHDIGGIYNTEIQPAQKEGVWTYSTYGPRSPEGPEIGTWENAEEVAQWTRQDAQAAREARKIKERKGLEAAARKAARTIKGQYERASVHDRIKMIKAIVEELEK